VQSPRARILPHRTLQEDFSAAATPVKLGDPHLPAGGLLPAPVGHITVGHSKAGRSTAGHSTEQSAHGPLSELQQRFQLFERQVEADTKARKYSEDSTVDALEKGVLKLEDSLALEAQAGSNGLQEVQAYLEPKLNEAQSKLEASFLSQFEQIYSSIEALNDRTGAVEKDFVQSRAHYVGEMKLESAAVDEDLSEFRQSFQLELQASKDREMRLHQQLDELATSTAEKLARDEQLSDRKLAQLVRDADESVRACGVMQQRVQEEVEEEVTKLQHSLADVTKVRAQADDDIVAALNHYTKELQKALSSVSQGALEAVLRS